MSRTSATERRTEVWKVCDTLAAQYSKPTMRLVKAYYPTGSAGDVQADIDAWFVHVFSRHLERLRVPAVPDAVVEAWTEMWRIAYDAASETFAEERAKINTQLDSAVAERKRYEGESQRLQSELERANTERDALHRTVAELQATLGEEKQRGERLDHLVAERGRETSLLREMLEAKRAELEHAKEEYEQRQSAALAAQAAEFETRTTQRVKAHDQFVTSLQDRIDALTLAHKEELGRAETHYRDLERRSLQSVDDARVKIKALENARLAKESEVVELRANLAAATARMEADERHFTEALERARLELQAKDEQLTHVAAKSRRRPGARHDG